MENLFNVLVLVFVVTLYALFFGFFAMWLWNWLVTDIFELREINLIEAVGLLTLGSLLSNTYPGGISRFLFNGYLGASSV